ncbi:hypothetical protein DY000_02025571 [Brassica cretica]|uniref:Uncharacterized protein n=1 Tax=Brassica cretica TaxID=69181 RepID=A0ABQ7EFK9_BRACR|nr:hypothetical protein DY000_02025571 [Brassica cretica]
MMDQALEFLLRGKAELHNFQQPANHVHEPHSWLLVTRAYQLRDNFKTGSIRYTGPLASQQTDLWAILI